MTRSHVTAAVFKTRARFYDTFTSDFVEWRSTVLWVLERGRTRSSCSVCCEWYDWRRLVLVRCRSTVFATPWHCRELSDERYADHIQFKYTDCYDDWRQASPTVCRPSYDANSPPSTTPLPRRTCCPATVACRYSSVFWITFSVLYYVIDSFSLVIC